MNAPNELKLLDDTDRRLIQATQAGLPLCARPYHAIAEQLGVEPADVMQRMQRMLDMGMIRRIAAVPNHYALGYRANGMTVWDVADARIDELGARIGQLEFVTHCYQRPRHLPDWPYNLFAMVHGKTREEVAEKARLIAEVLGEASRCNDILYSSRILKKTGLRIGS